eukprot:6037231-Pyramimonas_sp.AAC.1
MIPPRLLCRGVGHSHCGALSSNLERLGLSAILRPQRQYPGRELLSLRKPWVSMQVLPPQHPLLP